MGSHLVMPAGEGFELTSGLNDALELIKELTTQKGDKPGPLSAELLKQAKVRRRSRGSGLRASSCLGRSAKIERSYEPHAAINWGHRSARMRHLHP